MRHVSWLWRLAALPVATALAAATGLATAESAAARQPLTVTESACGTPRGPVPAGPVTFDITDGSRVFASVYLIDPSGDVYAEIPWMASGKTLPLATTIASGEYAIRCVFSDGTIRTSPRIKATGTTADAVAGYRPLPDLDMSGPVNAYRAWVQAALPTLLADSRKLDADVAADDLATARADWLTAHLDYERLGAAYNSFGDFDDEIDGRADGLPQGTATPDWSGFFSIENALWNGASAADLRPRTQALVTSVNGLVQDFPSEEVDPGDLPLRAHEILENSLEFQLTGASDYGSGTALATAYANTQGTGEVVSVLRPLIAERDPGLLTTVTRELTRVQNDLLAARTPQGGWTAPNRLGTAARQRLDGDLGQLLEDLSVLPNLLAPRTSA